jgi:hypothetical protein
METVNNKVYLRIIFSIIRKRVGKGMIDGLRFGKPELRQLASDSLTDLWQNIPLDYRDKWNLVTDYDPKDPHIGTLAIARAVSRAHNEQTRSLYPTPKDIFPNRIGSPRDPGWKCSERFRDIARLYNHGHSLREISDILGLSRGWVRKLRVEFAEANPSVRLAKTTARQDRNARYYAKKKTIASEPVSEPKAVIALGGWV